MTKREKCVVSAYTGVLMCDFADLHQYIEQLLGRPVWTHELAFSDRNCVERNQGKNKAGIFRAL